MPIATRTFRIFVSSTFEDLKEERNALQRNVFPKLRALCERHSARFQAIDLRWGVRDEAALDQKTMEICVREIERCQLTGIKPNFIVLLADRYGWQPLPARIPAAELDPGPVAGDWYRLDENADPPEYVLEPRTGRFADPEAWSAVEQSLHVKLAGAAHAAGITGKALSKYEDSATHQEILAGLGDMEEDRRHVFGFFRRPSRETDVRLLALKGLVPNHIEFAPGDTKALCDAVYSQVAAVIEDQVRSFRDRPLEAESEPHDRFAVDRAHVFRGRRRELEAIADYLAGGERRPLVLYGSSGSGKSALMAKASLEWRGAGRLMRRFIGATPESGDGHALLTGLCRQMAPEQETPLEFAQLAQAFQDRLARTAEPLVVFVDGLDQLPVDDPARDFSWFPRELPPGVKLVVSTTAEADPAPAGLRLAMEPMTEREGGDALDDWLREAGRRLQPWQRTKVLDRFARCGLPLYLKLAAEESKLWTSYASDAECRLGDGVAGIIDTLFARLAGAGGHGPVLVERGLGYLAAARHGLTEDEMLGVLTADDAVWADFERHRHHPVEGRQLPVVLWSRLRLDLEPYLNERMAPGGTVIAFFHRQLSERAAAGQEARHADLAQYFGGQTCWLDAEQTTPNARQAVELPFQQRAAGHWRAAEETLIDCPFLLAKCAAGLALDLEADYRAVLAERPAQQELRKNDLRLVHGALVLSMHVLVRDGSQFPSQITGRLLSHQDSPAIRRFLEKLATIVPKLWLRPLHPALQPPGTELVRTLTGHNDIVRSVAMTPDGKRAVSASWDTTLKLWDLESGQSLLTLEGHDNIVFGVAVTPDGKRAVSASDDKTLKVWDLESGRSLLTLTGHTSGVRGVAVTPDGTRAVSASLDGTLKLWDLEFGQSLLTLNADASGVTAVTVTPDGKRALSGGWDKTLKLWDLESGRRLRTLQGHSDSINGVAVTPDGLCAVSASADNTLKVWDLHSGQTLLTLGVPLHPDTIEVYANDVNTVTVTPDGSRAVSGSNDGNLTVWDLDSGARLRTLQGHAGHVNSVAVTPDGKRAVSASSDGTVKVWDLEADHDLRDGVRHADCINAVAVTPDGKHAVSASRDGTLAMWHLKFGFILPIFSCKAAYPISGVVVTPDGRWAVSASWDDKLRVWDLARNRVELVLDGHAGRVNAVALIPGGKRVISASRDETLKVWDLESGDSLLTLVGHRNWVMCVAVTPDGKRAVSGSWDRMLGVWDLETGEGSPLMGHAAPIAGVAVTPDGKRVVSASGDKTLKLWDLESGQCLFTLEGHDSAVVGVAVTPDGKRAVSASADNTLKVWDLMTRLPVATFHCDAGPLCCAFVGNREIVAGDEAGRLHLLRIEGDPPSRAVV